MAPRGSIFTPWSRGGTSRTWPSGWSVCYVEETGSTNADVIAALDTGAIGDRTVLAAGYQTAGRGRLDRRWDAPPDANLLVTLAFLDELSPAGLLTQRVALAAARGARSVAPADRIGLKWPNDLVVRPTAGRDLKLAGILAQRSAASGGVAVGVGLNVGWAPPDAARLGDGIAIRDVLAAILTAYDALPVGDADLLAAYRAELLTIGQAVRVELPDDSTFEGTAIDVDVEGRLIVERDGEARRFDVGDVVHLRPAR